MKIIFTDEQISQLEDDQYLDIDIGRGGHLYFEFNAKTNHFVYGEICNPKDGFSDKRKSYVFDNEELERLIPQDPYTSRYSDEYYKCPSCFTPLIYQFECCPKCGQALKWKKKD